MRPTRIGVLVLCAALAAAAGFLLFNSAYSDLPPLPAYAPVSLVLLAVVELGMARVIRDRVQRSGRLDRRRARRLHPMQVARAAALAKASSPTGALLLGGYGGVFVWLLPKQAAQQRDDLVVAGVSALAALGLVLAALLLERACRAPSGPQGETGFGAAGGADVAGSQT